jgi:hypothetical protein
MTSVVCSDDASTDCKSYVAVGNKTTCLWSTGVHVASPEEKTPGAHQKEQTIKEAPEVPVWYEINDSGIVENTHSANVGDVTGVE